ncbi:hypothetical protein MMJ48_06705 [Enterococcus cecorum]|nr:hypothetical protein [Enterococcus cecorum]
MKDSDEEYNQTIDEIYRIRDLMQSHKSEVAEQKGKLQRIDEMKEFLEEQTDTIEQFDDGLTRKLIKEITLYDTYCIVEFKSGNTIKVPR